MVHVTSVLRYLHFSIYIPFCVVPRPALLPKVDFSTMAELVPLVTSSGVVGDSYQALRSGTRKVTRFFDRTRGLSLLKKLPTGLEALVFGEKDVKPELLAALSLGGTPGLQLSTMALLKAYNVGLFPYKLKPKETTEDGEVLDDAEVFLERFFDGQQEYTTSMKSGYPTRDRVPPLTDESRMDGDSHEVVVLHSPGSFVEQVRIPPPDTSISLAGNAFVKVIGYARVTERYPNGLVVRGEADGLCYYCQHRSGELECSSVLPVRNGKDLSVMAPGQFIIAPRVLENHADFRRLFYLFGHGDMFIVKLLALVKVTKDLVGRLVTQVAGADIPLLSLRYLRDLHSNPRRVTPTLGMPTDAELRTMVEDAMESLPLHDSDVELVLFGSSMLEIISAYVKEVESEAARDGCVGVKQYRKHESDLIRSCIVQAVGKNATFAIFEDFRKHKLNIAVSQGITAMYFPGLSLTVAFPEGSEVQRRRVELKPACPFSSDFQESLQILLDLAPRLARKLPERALRRFAEALVSELSQDPANALRPVTEKVVRALSPRGKPCDGLSLIKIFQYAEARAKKRDSASTLSEASVAGILCQLGVRFALPSPGEGCENPDLRCFFEVCRQVWPCSASGAVVIVDCGVDISGCDVFKGYTLKENRNRHYRDCFFLKSIDGQKFELTGEVANRPLDELDPGQLYVCRLHRNDEAIEGTSLHGDYGRRSIRARCRVVGFGRPPTVSPEKNTCKLS